MTSAPGLTRKKTPISTAALKPRRVPETFSPSQRNPEAMVQRRELAMLLRSIKTMVRQSP